MATRSTIALEFADGTVGKVYCHWDGYLSHNGKILSENYSDPFKLQQLIDLGSVSVLRPNIGVKHSFDNPHRYGSQEYIAHKEQFNDMTTFYGRDRGESDVDAVFFNDFADYEARGDWQEYNYILRNVNGKAVWFVNGQTLESALVNGIDDDE
jgi:hypothetical protein